MTLGSNHNNPPIENMGVNLNKSLTVRAVRGRSLLANGIEPEFIDEENFLIPSQSEKSKKYRIKRIGFDWTCECPDFHYRNVVCKHIHAIRFWIRLRSEINSRSEHKTIIPETSDEIVCAYCGSMELMKNGSRKNESGEKQRFKCKQCERTFVVDSCFKKLRGNPKTITLVLDLYFKGISLRKIQDHLQQFYDIKISHKTIYNWIVKFTGLMKNYTDKLTPETSTMWHSDEMAFKVKENKRFVWLWNTIDTKTRFLLAQNISETREIKDATELFVRAREKADARPIWMVTDKLQAYEKAFRKTIWKNKGVIREHIQIKGDKSRANMKIERLHSSIREREKVVRAFRNPETAKRILDGWQVYYNYIRPNQALNGLTPAEASGIDLQLGENKWLDLIKRSSKS